MIEKQIALMEAQLSALQFESFSNEDAWSLGIDIVEQARREGTSIAVSIRRNRQLLFYHAMQNTSIDNEFWIAGKENIVNHFHDASYAVKLKSEIKNENINECFFLDKQDYRASGGCFPIILKETGVIGTITVSGMHERDDHRYVVEAIERHLAKQR